MMSVLGGNVALFATLLGPVPPNISRSLLESVFSPLTCVWIGLYVLSMVLCVVSVEKSIRYIRFRQGKCGETALFLSVSGGAAVILFATLPLRAFRFLEIGVFIGLVLMILGVRYAFLKNMV